MLQASGEPLCYIDNSSTNLLYTEHHKNEKVVEETTVETINWRNRSNNDYFVWGYQIEIWKPEN